MKTYSITIQQSLSLLLCGILIGTLLLIWQASVIPTISHDDGISHLAETGHQGVYAKMGLAREWVTAAQWKQLWSPSEFLIFDQIRFDIAHYDVHPPLYFWALHGWSYIAGIDLSTGAHLNIAFHVVTTILIFVICMRLKCPPWIAAVVSLLWLINGSMLNVAQETRPYSFLAMSSALYLLSLLLYLQKKTSLALLSITITASMGMLIHYHFFLLVCISASYLIIQLIIKNRLDKLLEFSAALIIAGLIFLAIHPDFYLSFLRQAHQAQSFSIDNTMPRTLTSAKTFLIVFLPTNLPHWWSLTLAAVLTGGTFISVKYMLSSRKNIPWVKTIFENCDWLPLVCAVFVTAIIWFLYIFQYTPVHAMRVKYLMLICPFYFVVLGQIISRITTKRLIVYFIIFLLFSQILDSTLNINKYANRSKLIENNIVQSLPFTTPIIIDTVARGVLPSILWHADSSSNVYAATQHDLLDNFPDTSGLKTILYISDLRYGNSLDGQNLVLEIFQRNGYKIEKMSKYMASESTNIFLFKRTTK